MNRTVIRRRRARPRLDVEALESRYVLNASLATAALTPPSFGPARADEVRFEQIQFPSTGPAPAQAAPSPFANSAAPLVSSAPVETQVEIDIFRIEVRDPFAAHGQMVFVETFTFQSFTEISNRAMEPSPAESVSYGSANQAQAHSSAGANSPGSNPANLEQSPSANAVRAEEAAAFVNSNRSDAAVAGASIAARRADSLGAAALPTDRRVDRPAPTAFATALAADAVRPADVNVHDASRPLPATGDLSTPRISTPSADPQGVVESTSQSPPVEQARDAVFGTLFVDGFAPRLLDHAFRALKSVESNLEAPDGSRWYRLALGCWVVAAALAYEAGRQSQNATARALRYASATLREPDPEDDR